MDAFEEHAAAIKANPDQYRELDRLTCDCSKPHTTIAVLYAAADGQVWLWTPSGRGPMNHSDKPASGQIAPERRPPRAVPLPRHPGDVAYSALAICSRCRAGRLLLPDIGVIRQVPLGAPTWARVAE